MADKTQESTEAPEQTPNETPEAPTPDTKDRTTTEEPPSAVDAGVPHVEDAAPDNLDTDPASSVVVPSDSDYEVKPPATMQEQKAPKLEGIDKGSQKALERGYFGETAADRAKAEKADLDPALTVQDNAEAVAAVNNNTED